jgi:phage protein D
MAKAPPLSDEFLIDFAIASRELTPSASVRIEGQDLPREVIDSISKIEVDLARDMADQIKLTIVNPIRDELGVGYKDSQFVFLDSVAWQPGNRVEVSLGYDTQNTFIAAGLIQKWLPDFPSSGVPVLQVTALDGSVLLMDGDGVKDARHYPDFDLDTVVLEVLSRAGILRGQVQGLVGSFQKTLTKKQGMSDYQFVRGLANLAGFEFRIYWDPSVENWRCNWREPASDQKKKYTFAYGTTLLEFQPQWGIRDFPSEVKVQYFDSASKTFVEVKVGDKTPGEDLKFPSGKGKSFQKFLAATVHQEITSMSKLRISGGGVAVDVIPDRRFDDPKAAQDFGEQWLQKHRNNFITGTGTLPGLETLRPGDVHTISNVGAQLSGDWEISTVRHVLDVQRGFSTEFFAHKVITS